MAWPSLTNERNQASPDELEKKSRKNLPTRLISCLILYLPSIMDITDHKLTAIIIFPNTQPNLTMSKIYSVPRG